MKERKGGLKVLAILLLISSLVVLGAQLYMFSSIGERNINANAVGTTTGQVNFILVDTYPPEITIVKPNTTLYTSGSVPIEITTSEAVNCSYSLDGGITNYTLTGNSTYTGFTGTTPTLTNGFYTMTVYAVDGFGNTAESTVSFAVSIAAPPVIVPVEGGGGGGGGGGYVQKPLPQERDFTFEPIMLKVVLKPGMNITKTVIVNNPTKAEILNFTLSDNMAEFVTLSDRSFTLRPGQSKAVSIFISVPSDTEPDAYTGKIILEIPKSKKELPVIIEVQSPEALFEVSVDIPAEYRTLKGGGDLFFQVSIFSLAGATTESSLVKLEYIIKDLNGNVLVRIPDNASVIGQISFTKLIKIPADIKSGDYVLAVKAEFDSKITLSSELFSVVEKFAFSTWLWVAILIVILVLLVLIYLEVRRMRIKSFAKVQAVEIRRTQQRIYSGKVKRKDYSEEIEKLKKQRELLESAHNMGYLKDASYKKSKANINKMLSKLK